jgi:hypothetical protein
MTPPAVITDSHGDRYAPVDVGQLDEWACLLRLVEDWLRHADHDTVADRVYFAGPNGQDIDDVTGLLGRASVRMRDLARGRP